MVVDEFKYSFFRRVTPHFSSALLARHHRHFEFESESLIPDIALMSDTITGALWYGSLNQAIKVSMHVNAQPGTVMGGSASQSKIRAKSKQNPKGRKIFKTDSFD